MKRDDRQIELESLIEGAATAFRERDPSGCIKFSPDWMDLDDEARRRLYEIQMQSRAIEKAADRENLSSTARAVLNRLLIVGQLSPQAGP